MPVDIYSFTVVPITYPAGHLVQGFVHRRFICTLKIAAEGPRPRRRAHLIEQTQAIDMQSQALIEHRARVTELAALSGAAQHTPHPQLFPHS